MFAQSPLLSRECNVRRQRNIAVLGSSEAGKTSLCRRFVHNTFEDQYAPTYENSFTKIVKFKGHEVEWLIKDTQGVQAGSSEREIVSPWYSVGYHAYILVYSVDNPLSFQMVKLINKQLSNLIGPYSQSIPRILVANKADLPERDGRKVSSGQGKALAEKWKCPFVECSAKGNWSVSSLSNSVVHVNGVVDDVFKILKEEIDKYQQDPSVMAIHDNSRGCCAAFVASYAPCCFEDGGDEPDLFADHIEKDILNLVAYLSIVFILNILGAMVCLVYGAVLLSEPPGVEVQATSDVVASMLIPFGLLSVMTSALGLFSACTRNRELLLAMSRSLLWLFLSQVGLFFALNDDQRCVNSFLEFTFCRFFVIASALCIAMEAIGYLLLSVLETKMNMVLPSRLGSSNGSSVNRSSTNTSDLSISSPTNGRNSMKR